MTTKQMANLFKHIDGLYTAATETHVRHARVQIFTALDSLIVELVGVPELDSFLYLLDTTGETAQSIYEARFCAAPSGF